jgi:hypothetical protein
MSTRLLTRNPWTCAIAADRRGRIGGCTDRWSASQMTPAGHVLQGTHGKGEGGRSRGSHAPNREQGRDWAKGEGPTAVDLFSRQDLTDWWERIVAIREDSVEMMKWAVASRSFWAHRECPRQAPT